MPNVLLTSVGRRVELTRLCRRAYERLGLNGSVVATDMDALAPALQTVDRPYTVPRVSSSDYIDAIERIIRQALAIARDRGECDLAQTEAAIRAVQEART